MAEFRVFRSLEEVPADFGPSVLTIGNFDGVHAGHRRILRRVCEVARAKGWKPSVLTFDPHPTRVVAPDRAPQLMTLPEQRCALMREEGIAQVLILPFTREVARLGPEEFIEQVLVKKLGARAVLVGGDFRFGHKQAGNTRLLEELGRRWNFIVEVVPEVLVRGTRVSSSTIRALMNSGNVSRAWRLLARPYGLEGRVVAGHGVGAKQTVPTLNLAAETEVIPARGVYITCTHDLAGGRQWPSVTNIGYRPTFGGDSGLSIETFLLAGLEGDAPVRIRADFLRRLRDERRFESPDALKTQILRDAARARAWFRRAERWRGLRAQVVTMK